MKKISNCNICKKPLKGKQTKYCSIICKNKSLQSYIAQKNRAITRKLKLIKSYDSCCSICGYNKNLASLTFHHIKPGKKFKLDARSLSNRTLESVLREIRKCTLVCQNCHTELHNPNLDLAYLSSSRVLYH